MKMGKCKRLVFAQFDDNYNCSEEDYICFVVVHINGTELQYVFKVTTWVELGKTN